MEYRIAYSDSPETLHNLVNEAITDGWEVSGGLSCSHLGAVTQVNEKGETSTLERFQLFQALVRDGKPQLLPRSITSK